MPHVSEAVAASHDRHDLLLVAAFAAGDLTGTERDQAVALTASCHDCAALRDDLVSIARATATLPPPIASAGRDFRLTPTQAASLDRTGWRRFLPSGLSAGTARGLGVALATFGLAGLLIGNVSLNLGSGASAATAAPAAAGAQENSTGGGSYDALGAVPAASAAFGVPSAAAAASAGAALPEPSAAASMAVPNAASAAPSGGSSADNGGTVAAGSPDRAGPITAAASAAGSVPPAPVATANGLAGRTSTSSGTSPLVPISIVALLVGVVLIVASLRSRKTAA